MFKKKWTWTILGALALVFRGFAYKFPESTELVYAKTIFPYFRSLMDLTISRLPFSTVYLFFLGLLFGIGIFIGHLRKKDGWKDISFYAVRSLANFLGMFIFFFLVLWGFNYQRVPVVQKLGLQPKPLKQEELFQEIVLTEKLLSSIRRSITNDTTALEATLPYSALEDMVRTAVKKNLKQFGLVNTGHPRTKEFYPEGFLRKLGVLGIYFPFTGESYIDPTLHHLDKPFTVAHEMAHSYGITNEGEANFFSWVICSNSEHTLLQYVGQLKLLRYQLNDLRESDRKLHREFIASLDAGVKNDLLSIRENLEKIRPISRELSRRSNDLFLKTQGVEKGVDSYAQLTTLAYAWRTKKKPLKTFEN